MRSGSPSPKKPSPSAERRELVVRAAGKYPPSNMAAHRGSKLEQIDLPGTLQQVLPWMDKVLHHLRIPGMMIPPANTNKPWFQPWFLRWCEMDVVHPQYVSLTAETCPGAPRAAAGRSDMREGWLESRRSPRTRTYTAQRVLGKGSFGVVYQARSQSFQDSEV